MATDALLELHRSLSTALTSQSDPKRQGGPCRAIDYAARETVTQLTTVNVCGRFRNPPRGDEQFVARNRARSRVARRLLLRDRAGATQPCEQPTWSREPSRAHAHRS